jgi:hypothetical protein
LPILYISRDSLTALMVKMANLKNANFVDQNKLKIRLPYAFESLKILYCTDEVTDYIF